jgi:hypothetical protein
MQWMRFPDVLSSDTNQLKKRKKGEDSNDVKQNY